MTIDELCSSLCLSTFFTPIVTSALLIFIDKQEVLEILRVFLDPTQPILTKCEDHVEINLSFESPSYRIDLTIFSADSLPPELTVSDVSGSFIQDRQHQIDAAIVRILKNVKTMPLPLLTTELLSQQKLKLRVIL